MDYETGRRMYHLRVRASDMGSPFRRETEKIFAIPVKDVNDNKPMFEQDNCNGFIRKVS